MVLSIIIPHFKETWETCHWLFDSIAIQRGCDLNDIEVLIVNDGGNELKISRDYPFSIRQINKEQSGVSATRNRGLDEATGDYVMFCDCDDMFLNNYALHLYIDSMDKGFNVIVPQFIEEQPKAGKWVIIQHDNMDCTFVHGKAFLRKYLIDKNIRFDDTLTIHEDSYFVCLAMTLSENNVKRMTTPTYLWRWNEKSVVRNDHEAFVLKTYSHVIKVRMAMAKEMKRRGLEKEYMTTVVKTVTDCYYDFQWGDFRNDKFKSLQHKAINNVQMFWAIYKDDFKAAKPEMIAECVRISRDNAIRKGFLLEKETLKDFIKRVCEGK